MKTITGILIILSVVCAGCYREKDFTNIEINPDNIILSFTPNRESLKANGKDTTLVTVELPLDANDSGSVVIFKASTGVFPEYSKNEISVKAALVTVNGLPKRLAKIVYQAGMSNGKVTVSANVAGHIKTAEITLVKNEAERLKIENGSIAMKSDPFGEVLFAVSLLNADGKVTPGQLVKFSVKDVNDADKGRILIKNDLGNDSGQANFLYRIMPDTSFSGTLMVRAETESAGKIVKDSSLLYIIK